MIRVIGIIRLEKTWRAITASTLAAVTNERNNRSLCRPCLPRLVPLDETGIRKLRFSRILTCTFICLFYRNGSPAEASNCDSDNMPQLLSVVVLGYAMGYWRVILHRQ